LLIRFDAAFLLLFSCFFRGALVIISSLFSAILIFAITPFSLLSFAIIDFDSLMMLMLIFPCPLFRYDYC